MVDDLGKRVDEVFSRWGETAREASLRAAALGDSSIQLIENDLRSVIPENLRGAVDPIFAAWKSRAEQATGKAASLSIEHLIPWLREDVECALLVQLT